MIIKLLVIAITLLCPIGVCAQGVSLMSYNIRNGRGMDGLYDLDRTSNVIRANKTQVIALQEVDSVTCRSGGVDVLKELAIKCEMHPTYARAISYDGGAYGIGLLSQDKPIETKRIALPGSEEARVLLIAKFTDYVIFATHFSLTAEDQTRSIEIIAEWAKKYETRPLFLIGDLNLEPSSEQFAQLKVHFTPLSDPSEPTFPADKPSQTIDYICGSAGFRYKVIQSSVLDAPNQSDHRPIVARLKYSKKQIKNYSL